MDGFNESAYMNALNYLNSITPTLSRQKIVFLAVAFENRTFTDKDIEAAKQLLAQKHVLDEQKAKIATEKQKAIKETFWSPEVAFPRLFKRRNSDYVGLSKWIKNTSKTDLEKLLGELTQRTQHWSSLYFGEIGKATAYLETEIQKRKTGGN
ncbi:MAG: hypothetical protein NWF00_05290 [Candidatus Bathyarchaeota archaeon]|nr:hypothetical protein [Candidatus Bathyarchaeota archaeon]